MNIRILKENLIDCPLWWQKKGLMETATGYGRKLRTTWKIKYAGRLRRIYSCCFSNSGTLFIVLDGREIPVYIED